MGRLAGKVIVVTGAGRGLGEAAARGFAAEGAIVGVLDRHQENVRRVVSEIGGDAFGLACDVADEASVAAAFADVRRRHGRLDVLATYAAIQLIGADIRAHELPLDVWQRTVDVNLTGVFLCCKHGIGLMLATGTGGSVINCGSPTGLTMSGNPWTAYSASKAGVMGLTRVLAAEYAPDGIRVNGIVPGTVETPGVAAVTQDPTERAKLDALHPIGRIAQPEDLVGIAVFLASDESAFATGAHFTVDGGMTIR